MTEPAHAPSTSAFVSIVIPARNEAKNLPGLLEEIREAFAGSFAYEVIVVDDGSLDDTADIVGERARSDPSIRLLRHARSFGQSAGLRTGVLAARGGLIGTLDGDGQNDPAHLPEMVRMMGEDLHLGLVTGQRVGRSDGRKKALASRLANALRRRLLNDGTRDSACGLKVFRKDVFLRLPFFDGIHRYLPALFRREGYDIGFVDVVDRGRRHGRSNYGVLDRAGVGAFDILGVWWLLRRGRPVELIDLEGNTMEGRT